MNEPKWLDNYAGQSTEQLISLESSYRIDSIILAFEEAIGQKLERLGKESLSKEELVILAVEALEREVNNGGYHQFFFNSSVEHAPFIVEALYLIGSNDAARLSERAIGHLGIDGPITAASIVDCLRVDDEALFELLEGCDKEYYEIVDDLAQPLLDFIKLNHQKIVLPS